MPEYLHIALRAYPCAGMKPKPEQKEYLWRCPETILVFDTETRTDATQRLMFGCYRYIENRVCKEEGLFVSTDLSEHEMSIMKEYASTHIANSYGQARQLLLLSRQEFMDKLYRAAFKSRCLVVGFNLPFDLSRIACAFAPARGRFAGGFSIGLWKYTDNDGTERLHPFRPRIGIKHIDSKRALKGFTARYSPDDIDLIPEGSTDGKAQLGYKFRGHFLDLRTLAFALTDRGYSLEDACETFGVEHGKHTAKEHGCITDDYIEYCRRDVLSTEELAYKLLAEYTTHPINLQQTQAYSPASIGKAYLHAMGIEPIMNRQPDIPPKYLGHAQSAFYGGRASARIRKNPTPVVFTDFLSMYPTVNTLMKLWRFTTAGQIRFDLDCKAEIEAFLRQIKPDNLFNPEAWSKLTAFVKIIPNGDILPERAKYGTETQAWQIGINYLYAGSHDGTKAAWFSLPDVIATVVMTGRIPEIVDAFRIESDSILSGLEPVKLCNQVEVDPAKHDFFKYVIEQRIGLKQRNDLTDTEKDRLKKSLKVLANATSYGIYAEMIREESDHPVNVLCHGIDATPFTCRVAHPDKPGEYCFPPMAALITGAARLMLALLEHTVTAMGGTYAMEDTDSMAILATENGGFIPCPGGPYKTKDGRDAVRALSWQQVRDIAGRFASLNPYDRDAIPGSILKIEDDNFDPATGQQRQIYCLAISAKRYALFLKDHHGNPVLLRKGQNNEKNHWSEHGLGHLLNPTDPESDDREWIAQIWLNIIRSSLGMKTEALPFEHAPAVGRITISSPAISRAFEKFNNGKPYREQIKPFNFLLSCQVKPFGHPTDADPAHFHLIAPYELDSRRWLRMPWIDQYSGKQYNISTQTSDRSTARVKTYGDIAREYEYHPESKCADAFGQPCGRQTLGLLQRRHVGIELIRYIGKESNRMEEVDAGTIHSGEEIYTEYIDPRRDEWQVKILPVLKKMPLKELVSLTGISKSALNEIRAGRSRPHAGNLKILKGIAETGSGQI